MPGFFIVFSSIFICLFYVLEDRKRFKLLFTKENVLLVVISLALIVPIVIPYYKVSKQFNYVRDIRETIHFALQPEDLLSTTPFSRLEPLLSQIPFTKDLQGKGEVKPGFIGLTFSILIIVSFLFVLKNWKKQNFIVKGIFVSSVFGLLLSLGPFLHLQRLTIHNPFRIPLPYLIFYYIIPGFNGIRNSARYEMLFIIMAAPIVAVFLMEALKNTSVKTRYILLLLLSLIVILEFNFPIKYYPVPQKKDFPKVYSYLSETPKSTIIIEMPIFNWNVNPYVNQEWWREYYSTVHFRRTVNGASGFSPFPWQDLVNFLLSEFPSDKSINKLKEIGVNLIIVHKNEYDLLYKNDYKILDKKILNGDEVIKYLISRKDLYLEKQFGEDYVFRIK
jgi:heme/copper-type cytochrome/quinol oxidase subunit 4